MTEFCFSEALRMLWYDRILFLWGSVMQLEELIKVDKMRHSKITNSILINSIVPLSLLKHVLQPPTCTGRTHRDLVKRWNRPQFPFPIPPVPSPLSFSYTKGRSYEIQKHNGSIKFCESKIKSSVWNDDNHFPETLEIVLALSIRKWGSRGEILRDLHNYIYPTGKTDKSAYWLQLLH